MLTTMQMENRAFDHRGTRGKENKIRFRTLGIWRLYNLAGNPVNFDMTGLTQLSCYVKVKTFELVEESFISALHEGDPSTSLRMTN